MASLLPSLAAYSCYKDRYYEGTQPEYMNEMAKSCTLYVGNLSFYTTEEQIYELFSKSGEIKRIIMGLDRFKKTPCGFCFVEYYRRQDAMDCMKYISGTKLDDRPIRTDLDPGYKEGRQFGRGASGGQVRDERRQDYDAGRGGYGAQLRGQVYEVTDVPTGGVSYHGGEGFRTAGYTAKRRQRDDDGAYTNGGSGHRNPRFREN